MINETKVREENINPSKLPWFSCIRCIKHNGDLIIALLNKTKYPRKYILLHLYIKKKITLASELLTHTYLRYLT